jgi:hypothetical protein
MVSDKFVPDMALRLGNPLFLGAGEVAIARIFGTDVDPSVTGYVKFTEQVRNDVDVSPKVAQLKTQDLP